MNTDKMRRIPSLIMFVVLLSVAVLNYWVSRDVERQAILFREDTLRKLTYSAQLNADQADSYALMLQVVATDTPQKRDAYQAEMQAYNERINTVQKEYEAEIPADRVEVRRAFDEFVKQRKRYDEVAEQARTLLTAGQKEAARQLADTALVAAYQQYTKAGDVLFDYDVASGNQHSRQIEQAVARARWFTTFACIAIFFGGILTAFMLFRNLAIEGNI